MAFVIGDIHGCAFELETLLKKIPASELLVFAGDYIDRGPDSFSVIEQLIAISERSVFLKGNHEQLFLEFLNRNHKNSSSAEQNFLLNGGRETLKSYNLPETATFKNLPHDHQAFFDNLKLYYEGENFIAVHAGVDTTLPADMSLQDEHTLLWVRSEFLAREHRWQGKTIYYGHTPVTNHGTDKPYFGKKSIGIDTGCVYGGKLTAINTETREFIQVPRFR